MQFLPDRENNLLQGKDYTLSTLEKIWEGECESRILNMT